MRQPAYYIILTFFGSCLAILWLAPAWWGLTIPLALLLAVAVNDLRQTRHAIRRNYPIIGHLRYFFESIRPEINQYFVESNTDGTPFNRETRSLVYQRAKNQRDTLPFGTRHDVYAPGYEFVCHSHMPVQASAEAQRITIGGPQCTAPYDSSIFIISAMSFGALSGRAVEALNEGACKGRFAHNTGEGGINSYHLVHGGDLIWQIGAGYFGCRDEQGQFDPLAFKTYARLPQVKMIELKLSQGAKPSMGGILPAAKVTLEIAKTRLIPPGVTVHSPPRHATFSDFEGMCRFLERLRTLSDGKPIGFKLCLGITDEFEAICQAMLKTGVYPDFITIDGSEGGTGASPVELTNHVGIPLFEALIIVNRLLKKHGLRDQIRVIASGKIATGFDVIRAIALGADLCASARGMMLALGCIQALRCDSNRCPTGIATQDPHLIQGLVVQDKAERVAMYHRKTIESVANLLGVMGKHLTTELRPQHIMRRVADGRLLSLSEIYGLDLHADRPLTACSSPHGEPSSVQQLHARLET